MLAGWCRKRNRGERTWGGRWRNAPAIGRPLHTISNRVSAHGTLVRLVTKTGHVRLILCLLKVLQELQAQSPRRLHRLCIRARVGLWARSPWSASQSTAPSRASPLFSACIVGAGALLRRRGGSAEQRKGYSSNARHGAFPHHNHALLHASEQRPTMQPSPQRIARTGTFCRFAGRFSFSTTAALAALRLEALSISIRSLSRTQSKPISKTRERDSSREASAVGCELVAGSTSTPEEARQPWEDRYAKKRTDPPISITRFQFRATKTHINQQQRNSVRLEHR